MPRPKLQRRISCRPAYSCYKPNGVPMSQLPTLMLAADELEALKLVDRDGHNQLEAARQLGVSRQTLGNIIASARHKVAKALVNGMALELEPVTVTEKETTCR
ncbi:hypothetical protein ABT56_07920 [Photobacterium aquae]|uniref:UPF0251 protein ABT56_07920 n=1 Tax=Photobacterium aquae TaxID=1195763 RepID=A0A0J1H4V8_9GAMM|nr:DUF134 domain-containing protein [Photobacterium aquae]KLV06794.1 hypothetical protein ABT56_07920 [Photobacterium aquae]